MKIISGQLRGAIIPSVKNAGYRPSTGRFKEAMFSILTSGTFASCLIDKNVLDLFAGTGSLGLEALSRGATSATFVDIDSMALDAVKSFASKHKILDITNFINADSTKLPLAKKRYDVVFIDPPYRKGLVEASLLSLHKSSWLNDEALFVIEVGKKESIILPEWCEQMDMRVYGSSKLIIAEKKILS